MAKKLLIACPTYEGKNYCISWFLTFLKQAIQGHADICDVLFVDNSKGPEHKKIIEQQGFEVISNSLQYGTKIEAIVASRNMLINRCLEKDYDGLLFVDTDVLIPADAIDQLLKTEKDVIGGVYLGGQEINGEVKLCPVFYKLSDKGEDFLEIPGVNEVMGNDILEVGALGFGCCYISNKVLQRIKLRYDKERNCAEDIYFCRDVRQHLKLPVHVHTGVKCVHLVQEGNKVIPYEFRSDL